MAPIYDCSVEAELLTGMRLARTAIGRGDLVVLPTDTVYGLAADAFNPAAVQKLIDTKGRTRQSPPPVLIPGIPLFQIMVLSQSMNAILLPILLVLVLKLANDPLVMGEWRNKRFGNGMAISLTVLISLVTLILFVSPFIA